MLIFSACFCHFIHARIIYDDSIDKLVRKKFEEQSLLYLQKQKNPSRLLIKSRMAYDIDLLTYLLQAEGYLDAKVLIQQTGNEDFHIKVDKGSIYHFKNIITNVDENTEKLLHLKPADPVNFDKIIEAQEYLVEYFKDRGHPFPKSESPEIKISPTTKTVDVVFNVTPGLKCVINEIIYKNEPHVSKEYIEHFITWKKGDLYSDRIFSNFRRKLIETGLFSFISVKPQLSDQQLDTCDVIVKTAKAPTRYFDLSAGYSTQNQAFGGIEWTNKNIRRKGEEVNIRAEIISEKQREILMRYMLPHFFNHKAIFQIGFENETDNYRSNILYTKLNLEKRLSPECVYYYGVRVDEGLASTRYFLTPSGDKSKSKEYREATKEFDIGLLQFPVGVRFNNQNDEFSPTRSINWFCEIRPFLGIQKQRFIKTESAFSYLVPLISDQFHLPPVIWFNKVKVGQIFGKKLHSIAPKYRFYLGGTMEDMRSYGLKMVGDVDLKKKAKGGLSYVELASEFRLKMKEDLSLNFYYEVGSVSEKSLFNLDKRWFHGVGVSIYYFFKNGAQKIPVQFGIAFPLNPRRQYVLRSKNNGKDWKLSDKPLRIDRWFQIYVSISQTH